MRTRLGARPCGVFAATILGTFAVRATLAHGILLTGSCLSPAPGKGKRPRTPFYGLGNVACAAGLGPAGHLRRCGGALTLRQTPSVWPCPAPLAHRLGARLKAAWGLRKWGGVR